MDENINWSAAELLTVSEKTLKVLRDALLNEIFAPGEKLIERAFAEWAGVSRTSIREALPQLEAKGIVKRLPGKGIHVTRLTETEVLEIL
jgi:DNA-binding GntR family transcriptional regulator